MIFDWSPCMIDAAHRVREDWKLTRRLPGQVPNEAFNTETPYHALDWKSFKLPPVA